MERLASALFGAAVGYAAFVGTSEVVPQPELAVCAVAAAIIAHLLCGQALSAVASQGPQFRVPIFDVREIEAFEADHELLLTEAEWLNPRELLLTGADRLDAGAGDEDLLVLDDVLAAIGPDSRVVHPFDRKAMPTPGQLKSRIDDRLGQGMPPVAQPDASQALSDALAELRRSLR